MNRIWNQLAIATNWPVLVAVAVLSAVGVLTIWAHDPADGRKQLVFLAVGVICMFALQAVNYLRVGQYAWPFYLVSLLILLYTVLPFSPRTGIGGVPEINGARAWINFGPINLQPAELTKIAFCMVLARYLRFRSNYRTVAGLLPPFALALAPLLLILRQPDLGTALVFIPALLAMLFVAGARLSHLLAIVGMGVAVLPLLWISGRCTLPHYGEHCPVCSNVPVFNRLPQFIKHYQRERVQAMFSRDPAVLQKTGFQAERALIAFGSGRFAGRGPMQLQVGRTVPEAHNDMILSLIGEQFGFIGVAVLLAAYLVLFAAGVEIAAATREPFGKLVAVGTVSLLATQTFLNLMVAVRLVPVTGVTLPFVSYGGSSLLASCIAAGLLLNIGQNRPIVMARDAFEFD